MDAILVGPSCSNEPRPNLVVRVQTSFYSPRSGTLVRQTTVRVMRRLSRGHDFLFEDVSMVGADEVMPRIVNLDEVEDGLYRVITINERLNWETGYVDSYDYRLVPIE
jgi:hypothetical protein